MNQGGLEECKPKKLTENKAISFWENNYFEPPLFNDG